VYALEPHPELFQLLGRNVQGWRDGVVVDCIEAAASDRDGDCLLTIPNGFTENRGLARIAEEGPGFQVRGVTLDRLVRDAEVGVLKIDAEGHEGRVLDGARRLLSEHLIRDVIFEEHDGYPSRSSELLESAGYTVYGVEQGVRGPRAATPKASRTSVHGAAQNYVATTDPERLRARIRPSGWRVLRPGATHAAGAPAGAAA
jgi:FkbM family methyltransferase